MISNYERDISSALRRGRRSSYMRSKQRVNYIRESINVGRTKERYSGVDGSIFLRRQSDKLSVFRLRRNSLFLLSPLAFSLAPCDKGATSYFFFCPPRHCCFYAAILGRQLPATRSSTNCKCNKLKVESTNSIIFGILYASHRKTHANSRIMCMTCVYTCTR